MQPAFRKIFVVQALALTLAVVAFEDWMDQLPDREELGPRAAQLRLEPISLPRAAGPLRLAGAWQVTSNDPRFGGVSALAVERGRLIALTDAGALVQFAKPDGLSVTATIRELPDGPGDPRFKRSRDSESLVRDPAGRGWWVGFENRHSLWLFDPGFTRALARVELGHGRWHRNGGVEGLAVGRRTLLAVPERGDTVVRLPGNAELRIAAPRGRISDAIALPGGRLAVIQRGPGPLGFRNALGILDRAGPGYRYVAWIRLPVSPLDNVEALAAEPLAGGTTRLWMMTDDNYHAPLRTLLFAYDLPPQRKGS